MAAGITIQVDRYTQDVEAMTGAASGMGLTTAGAVAAAGASVLLAEVQKDDLRATAASTA